MLFSECPAIKSRQTIIDLCFVLLYMYYANDTRHYVSYM